MIEDYSAAALLVERSNMCNISLVIDQDQLSVKFPKGSSINPDLLAEIRDNKVLLISYLKNLRDGHNDGPQVISSCEGIEYQGSLYYEITPVQRYWVDKEIDRSLKEADPHHGLGINVWYVEGELDINIYKQTIRALVDRHESLRSTFHQINGDYLMRIEPNWDARFIPQFFDLREIENLQQEIDKFTKFSNLDFDFEAGPAFFSRVLRIAEDEYVVCITLHHSISDAWTKDILLRDLLIIYHDLKNGINPRIPKLEFQLKDYMAHVNNVIKKKREIHKSFWVNKYTSLPDSLTIPCERHQDSSLVESILATEWFKVPDQILHTIGSLSREFSASPFIILQACFKAFIHEKTGNCDILIGTYLHGRDLPGTEDQIGCYAKTCLIRTEFDTGASFQTIVNCVKTANQNMKDFDSYTLMEFLETILPANQEMCDLFWKVNILYNDLRTYYSRQSSLVANISSEIDLKVTQRNRSIKSIIPLDMMFNFTRTDRNLNLDLYYDSSMYNRHNIRKLVIQFFDFITRSCK
jgi:NRPS condensation-like uncharacterized protein